MQASVENYRDIMVLLYADIAASYINVRTVQERNAFAENNLKAQMETMELTKNRHDARLVPALDVSQAELNRSRTASQIPPLKQTLGYGDITPQLPAVQSYAVMEAACGQVFLVARLVALHIIHSNRAGS